MISEEIKQSLVHAGIGKRWHDKKLATYGEVGEKLAAMIKGEEARQHIDQGRGWLFHGPGGIPGEVATVFARGLHLVGTAVWVVTLRQLYRHVLDEQDDAPPAPEHRVLVIRDFYDAHFKTAPFPAYGMLAVQDHLQTAYLDAERAVILASTDPLESCDWYSAAFRDTLGMQLGQIKVVK